MNRGKMGQNGQEPIKQPGVGVGLADAEGKWKFTHPMLVESICYTLSVCFVSLLIWMLISKY